MWSWDRSKLCYRRLSTHRVWLEIILLQKIGYLQTWKYIIFGVYSSQCQDCWWWTLFYYLFSLYFIFSFLFLFNFLFLEQLRLGVISHAVTSVTNWWRSHKTDHETWENKVGGSRTKWHYTVWTTHAGLMLYSWSFRVGCTVASMDHGE